MEELRERLNALNRMVFHRKTYRESTNLYSWELIEIEPPTKEQRTEPLTQDICGRRAAQSPRLPSLASVEEGVPNSVEILCTGVKEYP